jgi:hypothetical protein
MTKPLNMYCKYFKFLLLDDKIFNMEVKVKKVKCTLVQALRLCTGCMAHRGSRGIALTLS